MIQSSRRRRRFPGEEQIQNQQGDHDDKGDKGSKDKIPDRRRRNLLRLGPYYLCKVFSIGSGRRKRNHLMHLHPSTSIPLFICMVLLIWLLSQILLGNISDPEGGLLGRSFDTLAKVFQSQNKEAKAFSAKTIKYPMVDQRNNRYKIQGTSEYLSVILNSNSDPNGKFSGKSFDRLEIDSVAEQRQQNAKRPVDFSTLPTLLDMLQTGECTGKWLCFRCLALFGQREQSCRSICPDCFFKVLCEGMSARDNQLTKDLLLLSNAPPSSTLQHESKRPIPRIIHQFGKEEWLDPRRFPNFARMQNSWRLQNAAYVFHTKDSARVFVKSQFASLLEFFDSLEESDQLSLAGLLVLYNQGGVLAKANLLLEVDLDKILDSGVSFVASSIESNKLNKECTYLWNGFIAAEKNHPVIGFAIASKLEALKTPRRNSPWVPMLWDISRTQCGKLKTFPVSCSSSIQSEAKHLAASEMYDSLILGHAFQAIDHYGSSAESNKAALFLLMSFDDAGATRLTKIDNNVLIASTDLLGTPLDWSAIELKRLGSSVID